MCVPGAANPVKIFSAFLGARTTILAAADGHPATGGNGCADAGRTGGVTGTDVAHYLPGRPLSAPCRGDRDMVAQITATAIPPSM